MGNKQAKNKKLMDTIGGDSPKSVSDHEKQIMHYETEYYLYTMYLTSNIYKIVEEHIHSEFKSKKGFKLNTQLYDSYLELQEVDNPSHIYKTIYYSDIIRWNISKTRKKNNITLSLHYDNDDNDNNDTNSFILQEIINDETKYLKAYNLKFIVDRKKGGIVFAHDLLEHIYKYMYDCGMLTYEKMRLKIANMDY